VCSEVVEIYVSVVITHLSDIELSFGLLCRGFLLLSFLLNAGFLKSFLFGDLHLSDSFSLSNLRFSLCLREVLYWRVFLFGLLFFVVLVPIFLLHLSFYEFDEWLEYGLHLLTGLAVVHAG